MSIIMADTDTTARIAELERLVEQLEDVCGQAYQLAGTIGAPERVLDILVAAANGTPIADANFLPISADECEAVIEARAGGKA